MGEIQHKYNIDDLAIIDDEAVRVQQRNNRETGPGTLAEGVTLVLAYVRNNEKFCLGVSGL
jgi:hypothetical protein